MSVSCVGISSCGSESDLVRLLYGSCYRFSVRHIKAALMDSSRVSRSLDDSVRGNSSVHLRHQISSLGIGHIAPVSSLRFGGCLLSSPCLFDSLHFLAFGSETCRVRLLRPLCHCACHEALCGEVTHGRPSRWIRLGLLLLDGPLRRLGLAVCNGTL